MVSGLSDNVWQGLLLGDPMPRRRPLVLAGLLLAMLAGVSWADDWPTLRHDLARTGLTDDCVGPPYKQAWVAVFDGEIITTRTEPIVAEGRVFVGTYSGRLHCLAAAGGREVWTADLEGPILHSPCVHGGVLYAASMAGVWALDADSGNVRWRTGGPTLEYCTSPAVAEGLVLLGGRDGLFRALDAEDGAERWTLPTEGPIRTTAAVADGRVYFASDEMHAYAADLKTGQLQWRSEKLFGQTLRDYYPVLVGDKLILRSNPTEHFAARITGDTSFLAQHAGLPDSHWKTVADFLQTERVFAPPETARREQEAIREHLRQHPLAQSCFILDRDTGRQRVLAPVLYVGGCAGVANPPVVAPDGRVVVMYRTAYSNFTHGVAPMVGLGYLDVATGQIEPIYHADGQKPPWNTFWGTADEAQNFSIGGHLLYFSHQGTISGLDLNTKRLAHIAGNRDTWGGLPAVGWTLNEWHGPARGSVAVVVDTLYWITGSRVIAVRGTSEEGSGDREQGPGSRGQGPETKGEASGIRVATSSLPASAVGYRDVEGTRAILCSLGSNGPITIDAYLAEPPRPAIWPSPRLAPELEALRTRLAEEVRRLVEGPRLAPLRVEIGLGGCEYFFDQSGETFLSLSLAAPHLPADLRGEVVDYLREELKNHPPHTAQCMYPVDEGRRREAYILPKELLGRDHRQPRLHPFGNVYALWAYAHYCDQWPAVAERWPEIEAAFGDFNASGWRFDPAKGDLFANRYLAAMIGLVRIARHGNHDELAGSARDQAAELAAGILEHYRRDAASVVIPRFENVQEFDRWRAAGAGGFFFRPSGHKAKPAKFHGLVPEVGSLLAEHAREASGAYLAFVDRSLPGWYLTGEERQFHFGENFVDYPDFALAIFEARAYVEQAPAERLAPWIDMPWCPGDLYYVRKLATTLNAVGEPR